MTFPGNPNNDSPTAPHLSYALYAPLTSLLLLLMVCTIFNCRNFQPHALQAQVFPPVGVEFGDEVLARHPAYRVLKTLLASVRSFALSPGGLYSPSLTS